MINNQRRNWNRRYQRGTLAPGSTRGVGPYQREEALRHLDFGIAVLEPPHSSLRKKRDTNRGELGRAPVERERWIGGWEAPALARRLLVLSPGWWKIRFRVPGAVAARASL